MMTSLPGTRMTFLPETGLEDGGGDRDGGMIRSCLDLIRLDQVAGLAIPILGIPLLGILGVFGTF